jgi:hypothetical protein
VPRSLEGCQQLADFAVEKFDRRVIRGRASLLFGARQIAKDSRNLPRILGADRRNGKSGGLKAAAIFNGKIVRRMRFVEADHQKKRLFTRL